MSRTKAAKLTEEQTKAKAQQWVSENNTKLKELLRLCEAAHSYSKQLSPLPKEAVKRDTDNISNEITYMLWDIDFSDSMDILTSILDL